MSSDESSCKTGPGSLSDRRWRVNGVRVARPEALRSASPRGASDAGANRASGGSRSMPSNARAGEGERVGRVQQLESPPPVSGEMPELDDAPIRRVGPGGIALDDPRVGGIDHEPRRRLRVVVDDPESGMVAPRGSFREVQDASGRRMRGAAGGRDHRDVVIAKRRTIEAEAAEHPAPNGAPTASHGRSSVGRGTSRTSGSFNDSVGGTGVPCDPQAHRASPTIASSVEGSTAAASSRGAFVASGYPSWMRRPKFDIWPSTRRGEGATPRSPRMRCPRDGVLPRPSPGSRGYPGSCNRSWRAAPQGPCGFDAQRVEHAPRRRTRRSRVGSGRWCFTVARLAAARCGMGLGTSMCKPSSGPGLDDGPRSPVGVDRRGRDGLGEKSVKRCVVSPAAFRY